MQYRRALGTGYGVVVWVATNRPWCCGRCSCELKYTLPRHGCEDLG
jgi:hypothetical protein